MITETYFSHVTSNRGKTGNS